MPSIRPVADTVPAVVRRSERKRDQGIGTRSLYEKWGDIRLNDVVQVHGHHFLIAITIRGIAIYRLSNECARGLRLHVFGQLYIARRSPGLRDHSQGPGTRTPGLRRRFDGIPRRGTLDATRQDNVFTDASVPFMLAAWASTDITYKLVARQIPDASASGRLQTNIWRPLTDTVHPDPLWARI